MQRAVTSPEICARRLNGAPETGVTFGREPHYVQLIMQVKETKICQAKCVSVCLWTRSTCIRASRHGKLELKLSV
ncbi:hypothetical protein RRG08_022505 [Elysia crispata]|uniref:Uncharacterized protein n=1 Tax=Elysia crispata TaxID=231223 RepID=A0AAE1D8D7_9GAST|nr:hypothetical protein RRG08_022505 [Elysia crispata]